MVKHALKTLRCSHPTFGHFSTLCMKASTKYHETSIYLPVAPPNIPNIIDAIPNTVLSIAPAGPIIPATAAIMSKPPVTTSVHAPPLIP